MLCSVGYHLFCCHRSEKTSRRWMALDYAGISIGILGCYVSGVFYAFYCNNVSWPCCSTVWQVWLYLLPFFIPQLVSLLHRVPGVENQSGMCCVIKFQITLFFPTKNLNPWDFCPGLSLFKKIYFLNKYPYLKLDLNIDQWTFLNERDVVQL